ncbi:cytochrome P450 [Streptomyces griseorubiginosus]|uniref:cytochrome P450 n=1 Tax=Streptomyces griseorubiginosus TaxID=67304 RepID=UPI001AD6EEC7|nr:cytochrome P450 [Streptomyces griseorubiginosus]MBO4258122.1 cytochrome P450 [Streptomyces griseorubiginosus]
MTTIRTAEPAWVSELTVQDLAGDADAIAARLRAEAPVAWIPKIGGWLATTYSACRRVAQDDRTFRGGTSQVHERVYGTPHVLGADGDLHSDLREAVGSPVGARAVRDLVSHKVGPAAHRYLESLRGRDRAELMADYFEPLSVRSVADAYGFDVDADTLRRWFHDLSVGTQNMAVNPDGTFANPEGFRGADTAREEITEYLQDLERREGASDGSPIHRMLNSGRAAGDPRTLDTVLPSVLIVLMGGLQEPGHACGSTLLGLATDPAQMARVMADPALLPRAITEGMRWLSPLYGGASRVCVEDVEIDGARIRRGDTVWMAYGSANRDPAEFTEPDRYDLDRPAHAHLAFGLGRHACAGSALAPQIVRVALQELFAAFPDLRLDETRPPRIEGWFFRGAPEIHVRLS